MANKQLVTVLTAISLSAAVTISVQAAGLTGPQVVAKCRASYGHLTSYDGTVQAASRSKASSNAAKSTVHILFQQPGLLDVEGTVQYPGGHSVPYALLSDGKTILVNIGGQWNKPQNADMAIATLTGISQGAASTIPSMVLHTSWGAPSLFHLPVSGTVTMERVNGRLAYRIPVAQGPMTDTYWIDDKSFLFVKIETNVAGYSITKVFATPVLNRPTTLSLAALRKKMPHIASPPGNPGRHR